MTKTSNRAKSIFLDAIELSDDDQRIAFVVAECADDEALRHAVDRLLRDYGNLDSFMESAVAGKQTIDRPVTEQPGAVIGPYKLLQQIGEGGMGVVYMAEQKEPVERRVALKIIKPGMDTRQVIARFEAERQALAMMDHPNIAKVLDAGTTDSGRPYFVMELVNGIPVTQFCDEQHLTARERLELFIPICQAVQHAHQKGIIHRDIKPSNILMALYDGRPVPKVIDFGVAKATGGRLTEKTMFTDLGQIVGTIEYMSPEQANRNQLDIDTRSDVYSLGVVLYELLTGDTPFDKQRLRSAAIDELLRIIREEEPPRPSTRLSSSDTLASVAANRHIEPAKLSALVRGELDWIVMKTLEKDRARRYESASSLAADVQHYLNDESVAACPPSAGYRFRKFARRNKAALSVAGLILSFLVLLGGGIGWTVRDRAARQARVSEQVELILEEAARFEQEQQWPEALAAAQRAEAALAGGEAPQEVQARVRQLLTDLQLVARLEEIRILTSEVNEQGFDDASANRRYAAALREYGVDVDELPGDEAASGLRSRAGVLPALIVALDEWARCRAALQDQVGAKALSALAQSLDPDTWRRRVREALATYNPQTLEELANSADVARQAPSTVVLLALTLTNCGRPEPALELLEKALREHPDDFWLHFSVASVAGDSSSSRPRRDEERVRHLTVALALRPRSAAVLNDLGIALDDQGTQDKAIACYRRAIELDPKFPYAHHNLGSVLADQGKLDEAIACYRQALVLDPKIAFAHGNLGNALKDQGKLDEAIAEYRQAIELDPKLAMAHLNLGNALKDQGKLDEAIACYRQAIELDPKLALAHYNLGTALSDQKKLDEAIAEYRQAIELDPKLAAAHNNLGNALSDQGNLDEAIAEYRLAIELGPKDALAHSNLGNVLAGQGKLDEAIAEFHTAIELDPKYANAHVNFGNALRAQGKPNEAIACYRQAIELDPKFAIAHTNLGSALRDQGKLDEAIAEYRRALELDPKHAMAHNNLGAALSDQGKRDEAIACCRKAIELDPKLAMAHNNLGNALYHQGKLDEAIAEYRQAIELDPKFAEPHYNLGQILRNQGKLDEAIACYRRAIALDPKDATAHNNLGVALRRQGRLDEAIAEFRQALELDPNYAGGYSNLGLALSSKGDVSDAIATLQKGIDLCPNDVGLRINMSYVLIKDTPLRDFPRAREHAQRGTELAPENPSIWENLGEAQYGCGQFAEAVASLEKAQQLGRELPTGMRLMLAMAYWRTGDRDKACEHYVGAAARLDERNPPDHFRQRDELETLVGAEALIRYCTDRLKTDPDSANLLLARASARARSGQFDQAAEDYAQVLSLLPEPTDPWWRPIAGGKSPMVESDEVYARLAVLRPQHRGLRIARLPHLASREKWDEVSEQLETAIQLDTTDHEGWCNAAALALYRADADAYRHVCEELAARFADTDNPMIAEWVAMACLLSPDAADQLNLARQLAERAVTTGANDNNIHWFYLAKALADYRGGDFETAVASAMRSRAHANRQLCVDATSLLVQAMAQHQLGRVSEARVSLSAAHELMQQQAPTADGGAWGRYWCAWLRFQILRNEAEALIDPQEDAEAWPEESRDDESSNPGEK